MEKRFFPPSGKNLPTLVLVQNVHSAYSQIVTYRYSTITTQLNHIQVISILIICTVPPSVIASQYATSNCKPLLVMFI